MTSSSIVVYFQESRPAMVIGQPGLLFTHTVRFEDPSRQLIRKVRRLEEIQRKLSHLEIKHIRAGRKSSLRMRIRLAWLLKSKKWLITAITDSVRQRLRYAYPPNIALEHSINGEPYVPVRHQHEAVSLLSRFEEGRYRSYSIQ